jgi:hypothetical protein
MGANMTARQAELEFLPPPTAAHKTLRVIIGCEHSGMVRDAFRNLGHQAWSCDLLPDENNSPFHYQADIREILALGGWDLAGFHPPCRFLACSGLHWIARQPGRAELARQALAFIRHLMATTIPFYLENPRGRITTTIRPADQTIQPYDFGDDACKSTCLWLHRLPPITPTGFFPGRTVTHNGKSFERWSNQTDDGNNRLADSAARWKLRSRTYPGIAAAFAAQWGSYLSNKP